MINSGTNRHAEKICLRPVSIKTFSTHVVVKKCHVVSKTGHFTHERKRFRGWPKTARCASHDIVICRRDAAASRLEETLQRDGAFLIMAYVMLRSVVWRFLRRRDRYSRIWSGKKVRYAACSQLFLCALAVALFQVPSASLLRALPRGLFSSRTTIGYMCPLPSAYC